MKGYWSTIDRREGDDWKIRMLTVNVTPAPVPRDEVDSIIKACARTVLRRRSSSPPSHAVASMRAP